MNESIRLILWAIVVMINGLVFAFVPEWGWIMFIQLAFYSFCFYMFLGHEWEKDVKGDKSE